MLLDFNWKFGLFWKFFGLGLLLLNPGFLLNPEGDFFSTITVVLFFPFENFESPKFFLDEPEIDMVSFFLKIFFSIRLFINYISCTHY